MVDDDPVVRNVSTALLTRRGFGVEIAESGQVALDRLATDPAPFRFVLLDLTMPGLSGIDVLQRLRDDEQRHGRPPVTVFLMSGYSEQDVTRDIGDLPFSGFLQKPFSLRDLDDLLTVLGPD